MKLKKWAISLLSSLLLSLFIFAGIMFYLDPLLQYRKESGPLTYYLYTEMYSNPGIAQHYQYDSVLVGTSMIENTDIDEFDAVMGTKALRLPYAGGTALNMKTILDVCFHSNADIKAVYWELDEFQLFSDYSKTRHPLPMYLYRNDVKEDLSYLLNLDIFYKYALRDIIETLHGKVLPAERRGESFQGNFDKNAVLNNYIRPPQSEKSVSDNFYISSAKANLENNIFPLITQNPDTEFVFYFVPFSILYWDSAVRKGQFDHIMDGIEYTIGELLKYDNVRIHFYHDEESIITDLDNYKDQSHYGKWINSYLTQALAAGNHHLTAANYIQEIGHFRQFIHSFNFESIFQKAVD